MPATIIHEESFDPADYRGELDAAPDNRDVGTRLWFENEHIRVWKCGSCRVSAARSTRTPAAISGPCGRRIGRQRTADGTMITASITSATPITRPLAGRTDDPRFRERR